MADVLVVEDDKDLVYIYRTALAQAGHQVEMARNAQEALAVLQQATPDLVFLDMNMPDENGTRVIEYIHSNGRLRQTQIVVITADDQWRKRIKTGKIARFLVKPVRIADLISLARQLVG